MFGSFSCSDILVLEVVAVTVVQSFINSQCDRQHFNYLVHRNLFVVIEDLIYSHCVSIPLIILQGARCGQAAAATLYEQQGAAESSSPQITA